MVWCHVHQAFAAAHSRSLLDVAVDIEPTESRLLQRALIYLRTGRAQLATSELRRVVSVAPGNAAALATLGSQLLQCGRAAEAVGYLQRAVDARPGCAEPAYNLGVALLQLHRASEALSAFRAAAAADGGMVAAKEGALAAQAVVDGASDASSAPVVTVAPMAAVGSVGDSSLVPHPRVSLEVTRRASSDAPRVAPPLKKVAPEREITDATATTTTIGSVRPHRRDSRVEEPARGEGAAADALCFTLEELQAPGPFPPGVDSKRREVSVRQGSTAAGPATS